MVDLKEDFYPKEDEEESIIKDTEVKIIGNIQIARNENYDINFIKSRPKSSKRETKVIHSLKQFI